MNLLVIILVLSVFGEVFIELAKPLLEPLITRLQLPEDINPYLYISSAFGVMISFGFRVNVLSAVGVEMPNLFMAHVATFITGLAFGRGSNGVHDFIAALISVKRAGRVLSDQDTDSSS